jgi:L-ascorbate metabolism protein UlaG (beta-lactamase superfamily)
MEGVMRAAQQIVEQSVPPQAVAIWWLGQNSFVLKSASGVIMIDPFFSRAGPPVKYLHEEPPLRAEELRADAVLCTHDHSDHTDAEFLGALARSRPDTRFFGPPESAERMRAAGVPAARVHPLESGEVIEAGGASVRAVLSKTAEVSDVAHSGYLVACPGATIYNTGDVMRGITREPTLMTPLVAAAPDVALITTSPTEEEFPDFEEAAALAAAIGARVAVPAHYGCFARRTFDPAGFADAFRTPEQTRAEIIPYCGCYIASSDGDRSAG